MLLPWFPGPVTSAQSFTTHHHCNNNPDALHYADQHGCDTHDQPHPGDCHRYGHQYHHTQPHRNVYAFTDFYIVAHAYAFSHAFSDVYPGTDQLANGDLHGLIYAVAYEYPDSNYYFVPAQPII